MCRNLFSGFVRCQNAAFLIVKHENNLHSGNIIDFKRKWDPLPALERKLFELCSDRNLTRGVYYHLAFSTEISGKRKKLGTNR